MLWYDGFIEINQIQGIVEYLGFVRDIQKANLFNKSHMLIFPSKKDVFPLTILEALSYGIPTLAFNTGAISEIISKKVGLISNEERYYSDVNQFINEYLNFNVYHECRKEYLKF